MTEFKYCKRGHLKTPENIVNRGCKICKLEKTREWQKNNQEHIKDYTEHTKERKAETNKIWFEANKEHRSDQKKQWKKANADIIAEKDKAYREKNKETLRLKNRKWSEENKDWYIENRRNKPEQYNAVKKAWKENNKEKVIDSHHRRRAAKKNVNSERVNVKIVYQRDSWICKICGNVVNPNSKYPDLYSASLDHVIPLSKGGTHTYNNVQLTHFICNITKSNLIVT